MSDMQAAKTLVSLTQETCERHGLIVAAGGVGGPITFDELWQRSVQLAEELIKRGIQPEDRVGLWAIQCSELLVGIVGILAAGAVYVPLDPSYPKSRLEYIASNSGLTTIVSPDHLCEEAAQLGFAVITTKARNESITPSVVLPKIDSHNAAYVIYTSGSTGLPKGVVVEHHSLVDLLEWMAKDCQLLPGDRMMGTAPPAFDASVLPLLLPLVAGVTFIALAKETTRDPYELCDAIKEYHPRALTTLPTVLRMFMEIRWPGDTNLMIWTGGERMAPSIIRYVEPRVHSLGNYYGPTETTVFVTRARISSNDLESPIGTPRDHVQCVLLDSLGRPTTPGEPGELFIAGSCLARGYLNDLELTADRFITIDVGAGEFQRAYKTGDIARFRNDGSLLILGRADNQVKLRGFRIELGEIEQRLMAHPQIIDAAVVAHQPDELIEPRLVAFVKVSGETLNPSLREFAKDSLPEHMVPSSFVELEEFPLVPNGKIDQLRLNELAAENENRIDVSSNDRPSTELEESVLNLFASVLALNANRIGVNEDFFDLGGTSLGCVRLFMSIEKSYGAALPLSTIVAAPTARLLASVISKTSPGQPQTFTSESLVNEWEWALCILWSEILSVKEVAPADNFFELGGSEPDGERMLKQLRATNGTVATLDELRQAPTVEKFAALTSGRSTQSILVPLNAHGSKTPFFCVAGPGGLALALLPLARELGPDQPFYGIQGRGLEQRSIPDFSLGQASKRAIKAIRKIQPQGPYVIGGHSLGGALALKIVHGLTSQGETVALLVIMDSVMPSRLTGVSEPSLDNDGGQFQQWWQRLKLPAKFSRLARLPFVGIIRQRGIKQFDMFGLHGSLQVYYARRIPPWSGQTAVYAAEGNRVAHVESGWGGLLTGPWVFATVPGDHSGILRRPNVTALANNLKEQMTAALGAHDPVSPRTSVSTIPAGKTSITLHTD